MQSMANSAEVRTTERRRIPRQKSFLRGMIYFNNRRSVADCLIRDISPYGARLIFSDVNSQTASLFEMLGLTKHVQLARDESEALLLIGPKPNSAGCHV